MKIFISGAISGTDDYVERFKLAEQRLLNQGNTVVNPVPMNAVLPTDTSWQTYMHISLEALGTCDAIYSLEGWEKSFGAMIERLWAEKSGMKLMEESTNDI